ncbi:MAG: hypothetical protein HY543_04310 [Deltaproteobacteria bacterium]|nr:hypothetical protein [Deltaproteobacteria bacterium]
MKRIMAWWLVGVLGIACGVALTACAENSAELNRPKPYRPTAAPAATPGTEFEKSKAPPAK